MAVAIGGGPRVYIEGGTREIDQFAKSFILPMRFIPGRDGTTGEVEDYLGRNAVALPGDAQIDVEPLLDPVVVLFFQLDLRANAGFFPLRRHRLR